MSRGPSSVARTVGRLAFDSLSVVRLSLWSRAYLAAEKVFLRKQLALYLEREVRPRRADPATRATLATH